MRLYLIRHGQTQSNVNHLLDTAHPGAPLDETGLSQAEALAKRLSHEPIEAVYASDLTRAVQTAAPLAQARGVALRSLPGLREIPAGVEELNDDWSAYIDMIGRWLHEPSYALAGAENASTFLARYDAAIARIAESHQVAAAISHGAALRVWIGYRALNFQAPSPRILANTDVVALDGSVEQGWRVLSWADELL